ncbi:MAG: signal peptidase II [Chloroflexi bacterium]|nr:MAG: signal peptidase II [Chloroflexota bacterium]
MGALLYGGCLLIVKKFVRTYWLLILVAGTIIVIDQITKAYIRANFVEGVDMWAPWPWLLPYARIIYVTNTGVAFGMLQGMGSIFMILAIIVSIAILYYFPRVPALDWTLRLALGFQLAGALGNLIDRLRFQGRVTDFISVGDFPVFNIADASITIGVLILLLGITLQERRQKQEQEIAQAAEPAAPLDADGTPRDSQPG